MSFTSDFTNTALCLMNFQALVATVILKVFIILDALGKVEAQFIFQQQNASNETLAGASGEHILNSIITLALFHLQNAY